MKRFLFLLPFLALTLAAFAPPAWAQGKEAAADKKQASAQAEPAEKGAAAEVPAKKEAAKNEPAPKEAVKKEAAKKEQKEKAPAAGLEDKKAGKTALEPEKTAKPVSSPLTKWRDAENALIDPLSPEEQESFFILRNKHSIIRVIRVVERDIGEAVKSCAQNNADMKEQMTTRFKQWKAAVNPIIDTAQKQLDKDISALKIVSTKEARRVLKLNDAAFEHGEKQIVKKPVSTKGACQDLLKSMDRTEDDMIALLQQSLLTESVIRERAKR